MEALKQRIKTEGVAVGSDRINVDGFINHQIDTRFMDEIGAEFGRRFADTPVDKILTVEASGIAIALAAARYFDFVPVVFAKKAAPNTMVEDCYTADAFSFTKQTNNLLRVAKKHLRAGERVLIIDDFLANGCAVNGLIDLIRSAGATVEGVGIAIEKGFQEGGRLIREKGIHVESLAIVESMNDETGEIVFRS